MGVRDLFFAIKAKDETGAAFKKVRGNLREIDGMAATTSERLTRMGGGLTRFGAGASAATAGMFLAFRDSLSLFDFQERAQAKVTQAIKATGGASGFTADELFRQASALQEVTRYGDEDILGNVTARFLSLGNIVGDVLPRAQALTLDLAAATGKDLSQAATKLGSSLADPAAGLSRLRREGVVFTDAQEDLIKSLVETGRVAEAQGLILDRVAASVGGQAEAAAEAGIGSLDQLSNAYGDLKETVGGVVAELLPPIVDFFKVLISGFQALPAPVQKTVVTMGLVAGVIGPVAVALGVLSLAAGAVSLPILGVVAGVTALTAGLVALWPAIQSATAAVIGFGRDTISWIKEKFGQMADLFTSLPGQMMQVGRDLIDGLKAGILERWESVKATIMDIPGQLTSGFKGLFQIRSPSRVFSEIGGHLMQGLANGIKAGGSAAIDALTGAGDGILDAADGMSGVFGVTSERFGGMVADIVTGSRKAGDAILALSDEIVKSGISSIAGDLFSNLSGGKGGGGLLSSMASGLGGLLGFSTPEIGMDTGGVLGVSGRNGVDRNVARFRVSNDENIHVVKRGQATAAPVVNVTIMARDPAAFKASKGQIARDLGRAVSHGQRFA